MAKRELTEKQQKFLDALFGEARGDALKAKKIAGYADSVTTSAVTAPLKEEITNLTRENFATFGPKALFSILSVMEEPTALGNKDKLAAAKDWLDRAGFKPDSKVEVASSNPLFILPEKN